ATHDSSLSTNPNTLRLKPFLNRLSLKSHQFANSLLRQFKQFVHLLARERRAFRRALHFDESPVASADHVHVHLGARIFVVFQIEKGRSVNDAHADRGDFTDDRGLLDLVLFHQSLARDRECYVCAGDGGGARSPVSLQYVAIERDSPLADYLAVRNGAQRTANQPLNFVGATGWTTAANLARRARVRRAREHTVFGRHPTFSSLAT